MARPVFGKEDRGRQPARFDLDRRLVEEARRDPAAFDSLYRKYVAQIYSFALYELRDHHAAEDATERTFMLALIGLATFEERGQAFGHAEASTFRVWLFQIGRNVVANERRTQRRRPTAPLEAAGDLPIPDDLAESAALAEAGSAAWRAVARLPEDRRRVIVLRFVEEMSISEIAEVLGRSEGAIRVLLHRALRAVAADLAASHATKDGLA